MQVLVISLFLLTIFSTECTDLAAVYGQGIIYIRNAHNVTKEHADASQLNLLLRSFNYPIGLAYDPLRRVMFVSDYDQARSTIFAVDSGLRVRTILPSKHHSKIQTMLWNPVNKTLIWTESGGIHSGKYSSNDRQWTETTFASPDKYLFDPRGLALDYCNRKLFWTDRAIEEGKLVEEFNIETKKLNIVSTATTTEHYFHAIHYNNEKKELIWAETDHDKQVNSSCSIYKMQLPNKPSLLRTFHKCYPFALTVDRDFIYWSDWGREGIMRMSKTAPHTLVMIVRTPMHTSIKGRHFGAYGIVNMNTSYPSCHDGKGPEDHHHHHEVIAKTTESPLNANENESTLRTPESKSNPMESNEKTNDSHSRASVDILLPPTSSATSMNGSTLCNSHRLTIIALTGTSLLFFSTTVFLVMRGFFSFSFNFGKNNIFTSPVKSSVPKSKKHRTFGPSKKNKFMDSDSSLRPRDGVRIEIEDCCQMTLCDSPCYTSIKKSGKGYKSKTSDHNRSEDKTDLLNSDNDSV